MFENSMAFTVSASREGHWRLAEFTEQAGFAKTTQYKNVHLLAQQRGISLPFCLVEATTSIDAIKEAVSDIRSCPEVDIGFMPIVLMTADTTESFISKCIVTGFDDILVLPFRTSEFARRVKLQMEVNLEYFKTETYFGPDRRRGNVQTNHPDRRGGVGFDFEKFTIRRGRRSGVKILSHEKFAADDIMAVFA